MRSVNLTAKNTKPLTFGKLEIWSTKKVNILSNMLRICDKKLSYKSFASWYSKCVSLRKSYN